jgi:NADPH:quinone reductase-like Zn-dependent oxidoreductase
LTALTAWEGLFERLNIQDAGADKTLLIIGGAGGWDRWRSRLRSTTAR